LYRKVRLGPSSSQFEAIHPFTDGNGRTGRVLNSIFLVEQGLLPLPILYLSRFTIANKADYYSIGVLSEQTFGKERLFVHPKLMTLLTREPNGFAPYS